MDSESRFSLAPELAFTEQLPAYPHLSVDDIQQVAIHNLGLRTTSPQSLESERATGVAMGDFLLVHDITSFLGIDDATIPEDLQRGIIQQIFTHPKDYDINRLTGLDTLPQKYEKALTRFFVERALPVLVRDELSSESSVQDYIKGLHNTSPALLIIKDPLARIGYDHENYCGFSKRGRRNILPEHIVAATAGIGESEQTLLLKRYNEFLGVTPARVMHQPNVANPFEQIGKDVATILVGKTNNLLKEASQR